MIFLDRDTGDKLRRYQEQIGRIHKAQDSDEGLVCECGDIFGEFGEWSAHVQSKMDNWTKAAVDSALESGGVYVLV